MGNTNKNEKYTILSVRGLINYIEDFDSCIQKRDEIAEVLSGMFPNAQKIENAWTDEIDPSGNSIFDDVIFIFDSEDRIVARCNNWDENFRSKMKATIKINMDNDAFQRDPTEVARILRNVAQDIEDYPTAHFIGIMDINGNTVGSFEIEQDDIDTYTCMVPDGDDNLLYE